MGAAAGDVRPALKTVRVLSLAAALAAACQPLALWAQEGDGAPAPAGSVLDSGLDGAFLACESWVLDPSSWTGEEGLAPLVELTGLGERIRPLPSVIDAALPPLEFRRANHFFRIDATPASGYFLVVSDQLPICHITGGGEDDLQPVAERVLASAPFLARWEAVEEIGDATHASTLYRHRLVPAMEMVVSRDRAPGGRRDRVQVIATAQYAISE